MSGISEWFVMPSARGDTLIYTDPNDPFGSVIIQIKGARYARTVAAAPDLLAALREAEPFLSEWRDNAEYEACVKARAALAKAEG